jgi:hypothetical protein
MTMTARGHVASRTIASLVLIAGMALLPGGLWAAEYTYVDDIRVTLTGSGITVLIVGGSKSDTLDIEGTTITVAVASGDSFTLRYPGPDPGRLPNTGGLAECNFISDYNEAVVQGPATVTFTPNHTLCSNANTSSGGGGGGGASPTPVPVRPVDPTSSGGYDPAVAIAFTPTINDDKQLTPESGQVSHCVSNSLIKGSLDAVYYCGADGRRYVFPNAKTYFSWYADFSNVIIMSDAALAQIPLGNNVTYRPGVTMVKIQTDPKVYTVSRGGVIRWVQDEQIAAKLYGPDWNQHIDDINDAFFVDYLVGPPITPQDVGL